MHFHPVFLLFPFIIVSCGSGASAEADAPAETEIITPVTLTSPDTEPLMEYVDLNATSAFLQRSYIKASTNGYIISVSAVIGTPVKTGQHLFTLKTKEAQSIGNTINLLDTSFNFSGTIDIKSGSDGLLAEVNHQAGDYVQEGEQLAVINDRKSFVFLLNLPYELRPYIINRKNVSLLLPDGDSLNGTIASALPVVDSASQTQNIIIRVPGIDLPVNLIAKVRIEKRASQHTLSLPKQAVLSDETQTDFWVMQVIDSTTAVKVNVTRGIETTDRIEILEPKFSASDKFLLTGNFGSGDTAKISIAK